MEHVTALVANDATTQTSGSVEVTFLNLVSRSSTLRRRTFETEAAYLAWMRDTGGLVEIVSVSGPDEDPVYGVDGELETDAGDARRERLARVEESWSSIEPSDRVRDDRFTDEAA